MATKRIISTILSVIILMTFCVTASAAFRDVPIEHIYLSDDGGVVLGISSGLRPMETNTNYLLRELYEPSYLDGGYRVDNVAIIIYRDEERTDHYVTESVTDIESIYGVYVSFADSWYPTIRIEYRAEMVDIAVEHIYPRISGPVSVSEVTPVHFGAHTRLRDLSKFAYEGRTYGPSGFVMERYLNSGTLFDSFPLDADDTYQFDYEFRHLLKIKYTERQNADTSDSGHSSDRAGVDYTASLTPFWLTSPDVNAAIAIAEKSDSTVAAFRRSTITGIRPATAKLLDGFALQFDSLSNGVVNVRVTIPNPELLTADSLLSGSVADADIAATRNHFSRHFRQ